MTPELKQLLSRQRHLHRSAAIRRWWVIGIFTLALPLAVLALADSRMALDKPWRWLAFGMFVVALLSMLLRARRALGTPAERDMASLLDEHSGLSHSHAISTSAELDVPRTELEEESVLLARLHAEANKLAAASAPQHPAPRAWQMAGAACGLILLAGVLGFQGPRPVMRMLLPWAELRYTTITLAGPEKKPLEREAFAVSGQVSGRVPAAVVLQVADGPAITVPVAADGNYRHVFENGVLAPVVLTTRGGADGVSPPLPIVLGDIPHATEYAHRIVPPSYTRQPERIETQASFTVLRASGIGYVAHFDRPPAAVRMVFDNDLDPLDLAADPQRPRVWGQELPKLERTCGYHLEVAEADGVFRPMGEPQQIVVFPDKPPVVEVASNNAEKLKSRKDTFTMNFDASDDIGLADVRVLYQRVGDQEQQEIPIPMTTPGARKQDGTWQLPLAEIKAEPHDMVVIVVQARDGNTLDGPGVGNSEPIILEIPEDTEGEDQQADGGGGGGSGQAEQVNPLEIQQQLYRETLRLSLGRKAPPKDELQQRQQANVTNLTEMKADPEQAKLGAEYLALLETARQAAGQAAMFLRPNPYFMGGNSDSTQRALAAEAAAVDALLKAARIAQANSEPPPPGEGEGEGQGGKKYSLTKSSSPKPKPLSEEEKKEQIEKALADLKEALEKQEEINQELAEKSPGEEGQEGEPQEGEGKPQEGKPQDGKPQEGQPGQSAGSQGSSSSDSLAQQQNQARDTSDQIRSQLEALGKSENGADPALAAEQLKQAAQFQSQAAEAIAKNAGNAAAPGKASADALRKAQQLTESLLGETANGAAEPRSQALEYQHLIQEYTRRLSYDD